MKQDISKYNRGWAECQPGEQKRIAEQRLAKADDELPRGGNPWASIVAVCLIIAAAVMFALGAKDIYAKVHEAGQLPTVARSTP